MNLNGNHALQRNLGVGLSVINGLCAIDKKPDALALTADSVTVPFTGFKDLLDHSRVRRRKDFAPT